MTPQHRSMRRTLEVCAFSAADARAAASAGADRIELCRDPAADGLTPTRASLLEASDLLAELPVHPIVRPRDSFDVSRDDLAQMCRDVSLTRSLGYPGVVVGALHGQVPDWRAVRDLVSAAEGASVTFHRAFDHVTDQMTALDGLAREGVVRVLTSGGPGNAPDNAVWLGLLAQHAVTCGITLMAGGGVTSETLGPLQEAGLVEIHSSARRGGAVLLTDEVQALAAGWHHA